MTTQVKGDQVIFDEGAAASTPAAAKVTIYAKADGLMYSKDDAGVETLMSSGSGTGTVTSVGLTMPTAIFDVAGSPVTTSGTLAVTLDNQTANTVFSGPNTGAPAAPTFRALVSDDLPTVPISKGGTGQTSQTSAFDALSPLTTAGDIIYHNGTDNIRLPIGTAGQVLTVNAGATAPEYQTPAGSSSFPKRATMFHDEATVTVGNALTYVIQTSQILNGNTYQFPAAINDEFTQSVFIEAGTYTLYAVGFSFTDAGISTWEVDGVSVGTMDWYAAAPTYNVLKSIGSIVIATGGQHRINGIAATKNASSTNYNLYLMKYWLKQASD